MIVAGLSLARLRSACPNYDTTRLLTMVSDADVAESAHSARLPRAVFALRKARLVLVAAIHALLQLAMEEKQ